MSDLQEYLQSHVPDGWNVTHLIYLEPEWQANVCNGEHVSIGTGASPEEALLIAGSKAEQGMFVGRLASLTAMYKNEERKIEGSGLLAALGLAKPKPKVVRRV
jgi:hypothetical protein